MNYLLKAKVLEALRILDGQKLNTADANLRLAIIVDLIDDVPESVLGPKLERLLKLQRESLYFFPNVSFEGEWRRLTDEEFDKLLESPDPEV